jgi:DNA-binding beta-propeller fold protein YncE
MQPRRGRVLGVLVLILVLGGVCVAPAFGARARVFAGSFGCEAGVAGCTVPDPYPLAAKPWSVAVNDATGDVYVTDALNHSVQEFTSKGVFVLMFGRKVNLTAVLAAGSEAEQDVCTAVSLDTCEPGEASSAAGGFESSPPLEMFVAVDNSAGTSSGDVYVGDYAEHGVGNRVSKFTAAGALVSGWGEGGELDGAGVKSPPAPLPGPFGPIEGLAVDPSGNLWVAGEHVTFEFGQEAAFINDWVTSVFPLPFGVGVDSHENLYFLKGREVVEVNSGGGEVGQLTEAGEAGHRVEPYGVAVDPASNDVYVVDEVGGFTPQRLQLQRYVPGPGCPTPANNSGCVAAETFINGHLTAESAGHGLAVGPGETKTVYVAGSARGEVSAFSVVTVPGVSTGKPSGLSATGATLEGTVDPAGVPLKECFFEWGETVAYGHVAQCEPEASKIPVDSAEHVRAVVGGLVAGRSYHYRLVAANENDRAEPAVGGDVVFGPPVIESESSVEVGSATVSLEAEVDPQNVDTRVRVQYGTSGGYGQETGEVDIGAGAGGQSVPVALSGLVAGTEYHYRFVAENVLGEGAGAVMGPDRVFRTQSAGVFRLPDSREWELVSPRDRRGASIEALASAYDAGGEIQASAAGGAISYVTNIPAAGEVQGFPEFAQVLSTRGGSGWSSRDLSVPTSGAVETGVALNSGREYRYFSEDLSQAGVQPAGVFEPCENAQGAPQPCISPWASEQTALVQDLGSGVFTPLVTGCPSLLQEEEGHPCPPAVAEHADVPAGTVFGQTSVLSGGLRGCPPFVYCGPFFDDATPDFSHVVLDSTVALTEPGAPPGEEGLYEWSAGKLTFVGAGTLGAAGEQGSTDYRHAISNDGSRVFWSGGGHHLYMSDTASGELLQLDVPEPECVTEGLCAAGGSGAAEFQVASSDGGRVFFTDGQRLTTSSAGDLYECEIIETAGKLACVLSDVTPVASGGSSGVLGTVLGASEDGSYVYFVADGVLGDGAEHGATQGDCEVSERKAPGQRCNLYVWHEGTIKLVAVLSGMDTPDWGSLELFAPTARVSPNGQWLAFMSELPLTGYDNRDVVSGEPDEEVYLYDAASGRLVCASCDPTGARPHGERYGTEDGEGLEGRSLVGSFKVWYLNSWLAANIPIWTPQSYHNAVFQSRYLSDSGRLFFDTRDGLVPKDVNEQQDVYEYEPEGAGPEGARCGSGAGSGSEVFAPEGEYEVLGQKGVAGAGCVALISSGSSSEESAFMEASESGGDVFFITSGRLVGGSVEGGTSLYDAHECTVLSPCTQETEVPPACETAESCRAAPEAQPSIFGAPASATLQGSTPEAPAAPPVTPVVVPRTAAQIRAERLAGALKACRKAHRPGKKRASCERTARKRYAPSKASKSSKPSRARRASRSSVGGVG